MANHYVRAGAGGTADGSDWTNAWVTLPAALTRGDTYYIADGSYTGYDFDDALSGVLYITVKKATATDHGTETGWAAAYGDGVATFTRNTDSVFVINTGYLIIDGATGGGPGSWATGHGFQITLSVGAVSKNYIDMRGGNWYRSPMPGHLRFYHIEMVGLGAGNVDLNCCGFYQGMQDDPWDSDFGPNDVEIKYCYWHDGAEGQLPIQDVEGQNWLVEYNYIARNVSTSDNHSEGWQDFGGDHMVVRYNKWESIQGTAVIAMKRNQHQSNHDWKIYGNLVYYPAAYAGGSLGQGVFCDSRGDAQIGDPLWDVNTCDDILIYNNTMIHVPGWNAGVFLPVGTGNLVYNNIWMNCCRYTADAGNDDAPNVIFTSLGETAPHDYNLYIASLAAGQTPGAHDVDSGVDPFVDYAGEDFTLNAPQIGLALAGEFNTDMLGKTRGADGEWDKGAYEFTSGSWVMVY